MLLKYLLTNCNTLHNCFSSLPTKAPFNPSLLASWPPRHIRQLVIFGPLTQQLVPEAGGELFVLQVLVVFMGHCYTCLKVEKSVHTTFLFRYPATKTLPPPETQRFVIVL
jgi:hypothetical protein